MDMTVIFLLIKATAENVEVKINKPSSSPQRRTPFAFIGLLCLCAVCTSADSLNLLSPDKGCFEWIAQRKIYRY